jgi:integrase
VEALERALERLLVVFAAATGLRPGEWLALEWRDVDHDQRVVYVRRSYRNGRLKYPKTEASMRAVPPLVAGRCVRSAP